MQESHPRRGSHQAERTAAELRRQLRSLQRAPYGRYKGLTGQWTFHAYTLDIQKVQSDPYAPASRCALRVPADVAGFPSELWNTPVRARALAGFLAEALDRQLRSTRMRVDAGGQQVLERSSCRIHNGEVWVRFGIDLPARGRSIEGHQAAASLCDDLPGAVEKALLWRTAAQQRARAFVASLEDTHALRQALPERGLVAFVADGAILPRASGVDDRPLAEAVPFRSPESLRTTIRLPNAGEVSGMGIPEGITLIVGGGFHGKSTLLRALEYGVYDHIPGDGRELVVARADTTKIRAEDGRRVARVDVSSFVDHLPTGADTRDFSTDNASGSTSQAAAIMEAIEAGSRLLLVDEDTAATNLMIRDARMQALVAKDSEPLTPFVDVVRGLHEHWGVSTLLVMGGSGDYMDVADRVLRLADYRTSDVTEQARALAATPTGRAREGSSIPGLAHRSPAQNSVRNTPSGTGASGTGRANKADGRGPKIRARGVDTLSIDKSTVDLRALEQLVDPSQVTGIGLTIVNWARSGLMDGHRSLAELLDQFDADVIERGIDAIDDRYLGDFAVPRRHDIAAVLNRLRTLRIQRLRHI